MDQPRISLADPNRKRLDGTETKGCGAEKCCEGLSCMSLSTTETKEKVEKKPVRALNMIPEDILNDAALNEAIAYLPSNYSFEIHKSVWHLRKAGAKMVALQFPEGLLIFSTRISAIFKQFCGVETLIMGDVTYGACCVDDFTAKTLGCDFLIHYGHSCLIPINKTLPGIKMLYVFVEIAIDNEHVGMLIRKHFKPDIKMAVMGTVQFISVLSYVKSTLTEYTNLYIPQARPLSPGEVLGCTSPKLPEGTEAIFFIADGRFHLEASMIMNPGVPAYRYDPYNKLFTIEEYDHKMMRAIRKDAIEKARAAKTYGLILGTLGRQGSPVIMMDIKKKLKDAGKRVFCFLISEIRPEKLAKYNERVDAWIQVACPRLSVDWGHKIFGGKPLLSPYELNVVLGHAEEFWEEEDLEANAYPMDFYAKNTTSPWTVNYTPPIEKK